LSIIRHVLFMNFFYEYHCLWLAYPYLFVCVCCMCDDRITCVLYEEHIITQMLLAWSRSTRNWGEIERFYNLFSCFKSYIKIYVIFFCSQILLEDFDKVTS